MADNVVVYGIQVTGADAAITAHRSVGDAAVSASDRAVEAAEKAAKEEAKWAEQRDQLRRRAKWEAEQDRKELEAELKNPTTGFIGPTQQNEEAKWEEERERRKRRMQWEAEQNRKEEVANWEEESQRRKRRAQWEAEQNRKEAEIAAREAERVELASPTTGFIGPIKQASTAAEVAEIRVRELNRRVTELGTTKGPQTITEQIKRIGTSLAETAEKVGPFGGQLAQTMTSVAGKGTILASVLGAGGIGAAVVLASTALSKFNELLEEEDRKEAQAAAALRSRADDEKRFREHNLELLKRKITAISEETVFNQRAGAEEQRLFVERLKRDLAQNESTRRLSAAELKERGITMGRLVELSKEASILQQRIADEEGQYKRKVDEYYRDRKILTARQAREAEAAESQEAADKIREIERKSAQDRQRLAAEEEARRVRQNEIEQRDAAKQFELEQERAESVGEARGLAQQKDEIEQLAAEEQNRQEQLAAAAAENAEFAKQRVEDNARVDRSLAEAAAAERKHNEELRIKRELLQQTMAAQIEQMAVNETYAGSMMFVNAGMSVLNGTLQQYGTLNRENYQDLLKITDNTKAAFAAQVQAALWSLAQQAGQKSIMEGAEAMKENALGVGSMAMQDWGGAALHFTSAAMHGVASSAYSVIAGGAGAASIGVGMMRGEGGIVGLTDQEKRDRDRNRNGPSAASPGSGLGPSSGRVTGGGASGNQPVVVNYIYEAGAMNNADMRQQARAVARGVRNANRDGYERRRMRAAG